MVDILNLAETYLTHFLYLWTNDQRNLLFDAKARRFIPLYVGKRPRAAYGRKRMIAGEDGGKRSIPYPYIEIPGTYQTSRPDVTGIYHEICFGLRGDVYNIFIFEGYFSRTSVLNGEERRARWHFVSYG